MSLGVELLFSKHLISTFGNFFFAEKNRSFIDKYASKSSAHCSDPCRRCLLFARATKGLAKCDESGHMIHVPLPSTMGCRVSWPVFASTRHSSGDQR